MHNFCLLRHGETPWNAEQRLQGHHNISLSEKGISQAHEAGNLLRRTGCRARHIVSSDLQRASQTAGILAIWLGLPVVFDKGLRERDIGELAGMTLPDICQQRPDDYRRYIEGCRDSRFGHGESLSHFENRTLQTLQRHLGAQPADKPVIFVCHEGTIRALQSALGESWPIQNAQPYWFNCDIGMQLSI